MSGIGDVRPPEVKPTEHVTTLTSLNDEASKRPAQVAAVAMEAPDATVRNTPNTSQVPLPAESANPMSPDNGHAVGRAMHMLITTNVQTTQALVLTELKTNAAHEPKQQDHRREHRSTGHRYRVSEIYDDHEEHPGGDGSSSEQTQHDAHPGAAEHAGETDEMNQSILELIDLLKRPEPLKPGTMARVKQFLNSGAAALVTDAPTRFRVPFRI